MVPFEKRVLDNGLTVLCNNDTKTGFASFNLFYRIGSKHEDPERTGFAHLFEHLMFSGSKHVPKYDKEVHIAGGENNAGTTNDYTHYFLDLPADNIETAFWLESDRMKWLNINEESLKTQKSVVIEEFKERILNRPYGDLWQYLKPLAYKVHPYMWLTIGKTPDHIANATIEDVRAFYERHYNPDNAILAVSGNVTAERVFELAEKWFGDIPRGGYPPVVVPKEPEQMEERRLVVEKPKLPSDVLFRAYHTEGRTERGCYICDIISDLLSEGESAPLLQHLMKKRHIFSEVEGFITADIDPGLFLFLGFLYPGVTMKRAEKSIDDEIKRFLDEKISERELEKIKNQRETKIAFRDLCYTIKSENLAYFELIGDANLINTEKDMYKDITEDEIKAYAEKLFRKENCSTLIYKKEE